MTMEQMIALINKMLVWPATTKVSVKRKFIEEFEEPLL